MQTSLRTPRGLRSFLINLIARVRYRARTKRDDRLDLLRGFCVAVLVIDHIGGYSPLWSITGGGNFYISAAEGFVCISGFLFGSIYRTIGERGGMQAIWRKALKRAFSLYMVMLAATLVLICGGVTARLPWAQVSNLGELGQLLWRVATFHEMYRATRILMMYSLLLLAAPVGMWLLRSGRTALLLFVSWAIYLAYQISPQLMSFPLPVDSYFLPAAYQILFVHLMALGYHRQAVAEFFTPGRRLALFIAAAVSLALLVLVFASKGRVVPPPLVDRVNHWAGKLFFRDLLRPGRLFAVAVTGSFAYLLVTYVWAPIRDGLGWLLLPLGNFSLYCFTMHVPFTVLFDWFEPRWVQFGPLAQLLNAAAQLAVLLTVWQMARQRLLFRFFPM